MSSRRQLSTSALGESIAEKQREPAHICLEKDEYVASVKTISSKRAVVHKYPPILEPVVLCVPAVDCPLPKALEDRDSNSVDCFVVLDERGSFRHRHFLK